MARDFRYRAEAASVDKVSAGLLMYRVWDGIFQVLLVDPGKPSGENDTKAEVTGR